MYHSTGLDVGVPFTSTVKPVSLNLINGAAFSISIPPRDVVKPFDVILPLDAARVLSAKISPNVDVPSVAFIRPAPIDNSLVDAL